MAAVQILLLWTALLALAGSTVAQWNIANRNALSDAGPLRANFSTFTTSVRLTTTTISDVLGTAVAIPNEITGDRHNDVVADVAGKGATEDQGPATIHTITKGDDSVTSSDSTPLIPPSMPAPLTPSLNTTRDPPEFLTQTSYPWPPSGTDIQRPSGPATSQPRTSEPCTPLDPWEPMIVWSVVYTSTVTLNGSLQDYTPAFAPLYTPTYCPDPTTSTADFGSPTTQINLPPEVSHPAIIPTSSKAGSFPTKERPSAPQRPWPTDIGPDDGESDVGGGDEGGGSEGGGGDDDGAINPPENKAPERTTLTFITTDKNPSIIVPTTQPPLFTQSWQHRGGPAGDNGNHIRPLGGDPQHVRPPPMFTVTAGRSQVIINSQTFSGLQPDQSSTVVVGPGTFTIGPSAIIGHGQTIRKPAPEPTGAALSRGPLREINVIGGQVLTAIGRTIMVLHSTTYTYGPGISERTVVVDADTVHLRAMGISVHDLTLGGPAVATDLTKYAIVGGATITEIQPSLVVIDGKTITIAPDMARTTTVVNGQTITIGPDGVTHSSVTIPMAGAAVTTTFQPSVTWNDQFPTKTEGPKSTKYRGTSQDNDDDDGDGGSEDESEDDDDDGGVFMRPQLATLMLAAGIAIGVWELF